MLPNDPFILLSYINTKLRDAYSSLDALCDDLEVDCAALCDKLQQVGYQYAPAQNQFVSR